MCERKAMIKGNQRISVSRQCHLLAVPRASVYARARGNSGADLAMMPQLDELYLQWPFYGSRRLCEKLRQRRHVIYRKRVQQLMRQMGLQAVYPQPRTSHPGAGPKIYPSLLTGLTLNQPNHLWASDICYVPMAKGFMYLTVIMDWASRRVLAWRVSNTLDAEPYMAALEEALIRYGCPEIFNSDHGAQYIREAFTKILRSHTTFKSAWMGKGGGRQCVCGTVRAQREV